METPVRLERLFASEAGAAAFVNPDASIAVVLLNRTEDAVSFALRIGAQTVAVELPARSIATCLRNGD